VTPLTQEQYSELVVALEVMRAVGCTETALWLADQCSDWCFVYLTQWFHRIGPLPPGRDGIVWCCTLMVAELCEERC